MATIPNILYSLEENVAGSLSAVGFTNFNPKDEYVTDPDLIGVVVRVTPEVGSTIPVTDEIVYYIGREQPSTEEASEPSLDAEQGEAPGEGGN